MQGWGSQCRTFSFFLRYTFTCARPRVHSGVSSRFEQSKSERHVVPSYHGRESRGAFSAISGMLFLCTWRFGARRLAVDVPPRSSSRPLADHPSWRGAEGGSQRFAWAVRGSLSEVVPGDMEGRFGEYGLTHCAFPFPADLRIHTLSYPPRELRVTVCGFDFAQACCTLVSGDTAPFKLCCPT